LASADDNLRTLPQVRLWVVDVEATVAAVGRSNPAYRHQALGHGSTNHLDQGAMSFLLRHRANHSSESVYGPAAAPDHLAEVLACHMDLEYDSAILFGIRLNANRFGIVD
jgi:hypothetical protein